MEPETVTPLAVDIATAARMTSLSPQVIRRYIQRGILSATRCGRRVVVPVNALKQLVRRGVPSSQTHE
jgi:hypothetical protein